MYSKHVAASVMSHAASAIGSPLFSRLQLGPLDRVLPNDLGEANENASPLAGHSKGRQRRNEMGQRGVRGTDPGE